MEIIGKCATVMLVLIALLAFTYQTISMIYNDLN